VGHAADVHLEEVADVAEVVVQVDDALGDFLRSPAKTMPPGE
jgi:hypothetical protein